METSQTKEGILSEIENLLESLIAQKSITKEEIIYLIREGLAIVEDANEEVMRWT